MHKPRPSPEATTAAATAPPRKPRALRTIETPVAPHQRFPQATFLGTTKATHGATVHLWTPKGRIAFTVPQVVHSTPIDPKKLVTVRIDADGAAHIEALQAPPLLPPPARIEPPLQVSREAILASIDAPQTPAINDLLADLPASARTGMSASGLFDYAMADIRRSLGRDEVNHANATAFISSHKADAYSQKQRVTRLSYQKADARFQRDRPAGFFYGQLCPKRSVSGQRCRMQQGNIDPVPASRPAAKRNSNSMHEPPPGKGAPLPCASIARGVGQLISAMGRRGVRASTNPRCGVPL